MGTAIFMVLMVCGYWYTTRDVSSRFKLKRTFGWDVYFVVALYGCIFVLQGVLVIAIVYLLLWGFSGLMNHIPGLLSDELQLQRDFIMWSFLGIQAPVVIMLAVSVLLCLFCTSWSRSRNLDPAGRKSLYQQLTRSNGVEGLLYQCMDQGDLVFVTLRSRRVYIGMVHTLRCESGSTDNVVLIPMVSGFRDPETQKMQVEHNYASYYQKHGITPASEPISALYFRKVIMLNQIETLSLFDPATAMAFEALAEREREEEAEGGGMKSMFP
ncbi:hypothetical protein [Nissabacter sp. SGAir0207]|uniref:hypothetical protein n=1 Tax=Nissabacter sp. SGAir0207 TaxID=2126321 RepID=UPI0010CD465C|nr:hypothetical protein [Nissabacter sp. SGAir0207]QCR35999.1 hypothetical protein C1N62_07815 [Nissabacter sp. SGAir0207]